MPFCASCGSPVQGKFCPSCGASAAGGATPPSGGPAPSAAPPQADAGMAPNVAGTLCYVLGLLTGIRAEEAKVEGKLAKVTKLNANYGVMNKCYYALGVFRKDPELLIKAKKYALKMKSYPFVQRIEKELFRITGDPYWAGRVKITQEKLEQMNRFGTIEELLGFKK